jgi:hypothetical protein
MKVCADTVIAATAQNASSMNNVFVEFWSFFARSSPSKKLVAASWVKSHGFKTRRSTGVTNDGGAGNGGGDYPFKLSSCQTVFYLIREMWLSRRGQRHKFTEALRQSIAVDDFALIARYPFVVAARSPLLFRLYPQPDVSQSVRVHT